CGTGRRCGGGSDGGEPHLVLTRDFQMKDRGQVNMSVLETDNPVRDFLPPAQDTDVPSRVASGDRSPEPIDQGRIRTRGEGLGPYAHLRLACVQTNNELS